MACAPFALQELRRVALGRVGQQPIKYVQELGHAGAVARRDKTDRDQVPFAQRLLQWGMQLARVHVALIEVALDKIGVHFHHLFDQRAVGLRHR